MVLIMSDTSQGLSMNSPDAGEGLIERLVREGIGCTWRADGDATWVGTTSATSVRPVTRCGKGHARRGVSIPANTTRLACHTRAGRSRSAATPMVHRGCPSNTDGPSLWVRFKVLPQRSCWKRGERYLTRQCYSRRPVLGAAGVEVAYLLTRGSVSRSGTTRTVRVPRRSGRPPRYAPQDRRAPTLSAASRSAVRSAAVSAGRRVTSGWRSHRPRQRAAVLDQGKRLVTRFISTLTVNHPDHLDSYELVAYV